MMDLLVYMLCAGLLVVGALAFIWALSIPSRFRAVLACLAAFVPVAVAVWIFRGSGLKVGDFDRVLRSSAADVQQISRNFKEAQNSRQTFENLLEPPPERNHQR